MLTIDKEFKELIPPLTENEYSGLEQSLLSDGCRDALVVWDDILVDGHNRYEICQKHNIPYKTVNKEFNTRDDAIIWIIKHQFSRRNLTAYERARLALRLKPVIAAKAEQNLHLSEGKGCQKSDKVKPVDTKKEIAAAAGVSHDTIAKVAMIEEKASEEIKQKLRSGDPSLSINKAYAEIKRAEKEQKKEEKAERKEFVLEKTIPDGYCTLFCEDIRSRLEQIANESIDYIITDPPYPKEYLSLYSDLSLLARRVLKPNGSLIVMTGQTYLPEVISRLSEHMAYHWCLAYTTPGGQSPQLFQKKVNSFWKPVLWFTKGEYNGDWIGDVLKSPVNDNDKRYHEWGQSLGGMRDIVERFTNPGETILDPFLGGGTTGVVAITMGRKFIGVDIEQKNIDISDERIKEAYTVCSK